MFGDEKRGGAENNNDNNDDSNSHDWTTGRQRRDERWEFRWKRWWFDKFDFCVTDSRWKQRDEWTGKRKSGIWSRQC